MQGVTQRFPSEEILLNYLLECAETNPRNDNERRVLEITSRIFAGQKMISQGIRVGVQLVFITETVPNLSDVDKKDILDRIVKVLRKFLPKK